MTIRMVIIFVKKIIVIIVVMEKMTACNDAKIDLIGQVILNFFRRFMYESV